MRRRDRLHFDGIAAMPDHALATALTYAGQLVDMLDRCGAAGPFRVILTHHPRERQLRRRFHRLRDDESWQVEPADAGRDAAISSSIAPCPRERLREADRKINSSGFS